MCHILPFFYPFLPILSLVLVNNLRTTACHQYLYMRRCPCLPCLGSRHMQARLPGSWRLRTNLINPNIPNGGTQQIRTPALSSPLHSSAATSPDNIELPWSFLSWSGMILPPAPSQHSNSYQNKETLLIKVQNQGWQKWILTSWQKTDACFFLDDF